VTYGLLFVATAQVHDLQPAGARILAVLAHVAMLEQCTLTITCGREAHGRTNPHTLGKAFDVRTKDLESTRVLRVYDHARRLLGRDFTVLYEVPVLARAGVLAEIATVNPAASAPHLHIQLRKGLAVWPAVDI
jgi:hypothetical protein